MTCQASGGQGALLKDAARGRCEDRPKEDVIKAGAVSQTPSPKATQPLHNTCATPEVKTMHLHAVQQG